MLEINHDYQALNNIDIVVHAAALKQVPAAKKRQLKLMLLDVKI